MKIGFTVGVWDLLHEGHIDLLKRAKEYCDYLVVGIMTDYWVKVQKGFTRPKQPLVLRYNQLKKMDLCDKIVILDTLDMSPYLQICDVWIRGEDQSKMRPEDFQNIVILKHKKKISTTLVIEKGQDG